MLRKHATSMSEDLLAGSLELSGFRVPRPRSFLNFLGAIWALFARALVFFCGLHP